MKSLMSSNSQVPRSLKTKSRHAVNFVVTAHVTCGTSVDKVGILALVIWTWEWAAAPKSHFLSPDSLAKGVFLAKIV